ncbi:MAG: hypothetical protein ABR577_18335 [Pyrinomonadaceae bacterium]
MVGSISKALLVCFALFMTSCAVKEQVVQSQSNSNINANQTANVQNSSNTNVAENKTIDYFAHIKPEHRGVLREWLKSKTFLRPAVEEIDSSDFEGNLKFIRDTIGENGYQYYSTGDMNRDGKADFAVLLVDSRKRKEEVDFFAMVIFNAPFRKGQKPAYYEENLYGISNSYIVYDLMTEKHLYLGKFESDVYCATYYPKGKTYYFKDCME